MLNISSKNKITYLNIIKTYNFLKALNRRMPDIEKFLEHPKIKKLFEGNHRDTILLQYKSLRGRHQTSIG